MPFSYSNPTPSERRPLLRCALAFMKTHMQAIKVQVDFKDIILQDNEEDGTLTGDVRFILYKGDHYHLTVSSDWGEDIFVDTNDVWDNGDHVGISIFPESIKITQIVES